MSLNDMLAPPGSPSAPSSHVTAQQGKKPYKSFRKKYRKLKLRFDRSLAESNAFLRAEDRASALARRLQEQNDQVLELLLDLNESTNLPDHLRFNIRPETYSAPGLRERLLADLQNARDDLHAGKITVEAFAAYEKHMQEELSQLGARNLADLEKIPHTLPGADLPDDLKADLFDPHPAGYLDPAHEDEYLHILDASIQNSTENPAEAALTSNRNAPLTDKEVADRNPVSVLNWLRRNANALEPDKEADAASESKPSKPPRGGKKTSLGEDDEPYRPKGGTGKKRKRETDEGPKGPKKKANRMMREEAATPS